MSWLRVFVVVVVISSAVPSPTANVGRSIHLTPEIIIENGYHAERHHVTTEDGYILEMHRIPFKRYDTEGDADRPVAFLMHGLAGASSTFIGLGPEYAIGYNLADAGFDVWMGNHRGTKNSRYHVTLNPDYSGHAVEFFDFTWEEVGMIDIPAMIDYILELTGNEKLHYIGHSQGGTVFLVLASMRPEYNEKFATVDLLAGVGYMEHLPNFLLRNLAQFTDSIWGLFLALGFVEIFPSISNSNNTFTVDSTKYHPSDYCVGDPTYKDLCNLLGMSEILEQNTIIDIIESIEGGGGSVKQVIHYGQNVRDKTFQRWDYGTENIENYGTPNPPSYNLSLITADVIMHYTISDTLLDEKDVLAMAGDMPNAGVRRVARDTFRHTDFHSSNDVRELVTEYIIDRIQKSTNGTDAENQPNSAVSIFFGLRLKMYLIILCLIYIS